MIGWPQDREIGDPIRNQNLIFWPLGTNQFSLSAGTTQPLVRGISNFAKMALKNSRYGKNVINSF